jgi:hypothetical protein
MDITPGTQTAVIDCACVIHSNGYDWQYVDKLHNMLQRHLSSTVRLHVYTEADRDVPAHMVKHELQEWPGIAGPKKSWWYKMQLFDPTHFSGQLLYLDLDVVITNNIDWITALSRRNFWAIHDFRRMWKQSCRTINSSVMYFNTTTYQYIWEKFQRHALADITAQYKGDQDFVTEAVDRNHLRYFDLERIVSWRWQALDGGLRNRFRTYHTPGAGTVIAPNTSILVFHGDPKPHEICDPVIKNHWI